MSERRPKRFPWALAIGGAALFGAIAWSMWVDTVRPLVEAGDTRALALHAAGLPLIFVGLGVFVWGGGRFVRQTFGAMADPDVRARAAVVRQGDDPAGVRAARRQNTGALFSAWKRPALIMLAGFAGIALGGYLINL